MKPNQTKTSDEQWINTTVDYGPHRHLHECFEAQVVQTPHAPAVIFNNNTLSYQQLNQKANQLAHYLIDLGVGVESLVGVSVERSLEMVISLYAILKAGGAYIPIDPTYPVERMAYMLQDSAPQVLLTQEKLLSIIPKQSAKTVCLDTEWSKISQYSTENPDIAISPNNLAYVIYTSGSTGKPKGVMNEQRGIYNRIKWMQETYHLTATDCVIQKTPFSFDVSVWEFFWPLMFGARLVVAEPEGHKDPDYLIDVIIQKNITTIHFVPSMLQVFLGHPNVERCNDCLKRVICSGEALSYDLQQRYFSHLSAPLYNLYGPTEAAVDVTHYTCQPDSHLKTVPIGKPIANIQIYILDKQLHPVPMGEAGELHIGGVGVARGYLNKPELTEEKFIADPFKITDNFDAVPRLYKTGDLARYLPDGNIDYLGRLDFQVKIRGFRIELGEIETRLREHPQVHEAVVVAREDIPGQKRLVAYILPHPEQAAVISRRLKLEQQGQLKDKLLHHLPNGLAIVCQNKATAEFSYKEIFDDKVYLQHGISLTDDSCIFDVGANIGLFALFAAQYCQKGKIYAFEPIPPTFDLLHLNLKLHGITNVETFNLGVGSKIEQVEFTHYPNLSILSGRFADSSEEQQVLQAFMASQQENSENELSKELLDELLTNRLSTESVTSDVKTISSIIEEYNISQIDLLKIDVEKAELDVLNGIDIQDWPKIKQIVIEVHDEDGSLQKVTDILNSHGYTIHIEQETFLKNSSLYNIYATMLPKSQTPAIPIKTHWLNTVQLEQDLRSFLSDGLPEYMVPTAFVPLGELPLSPNGKLDRKSLPPPKLRPSQEYIPPTTPVEKQLTELWQAVLHIDSVGIHDNFFELGGDSLLGAALVSQIRQQFQINLSVDIIFQHSTIFELASHIHINSNDTDKKLFQKIAPRALETPIPLTFIQEGFWFLHQLDPDSTAYNVYLSLELTGDLSATVLEKCINELIQRHEILRTTFEVTENGNVVQIIHPAKPRALPCVDLRHVPTEQKESQIQKIVNKTIKQVFNFQGPLWQIKLVQSTESVHVLVISFHHIIADGQSLIIFFEELARLYQAQAQKEARPLDMLDIQYADFAVWQRDHAAQNRYIKELDYWKKQLHHQSARIELPTNQSHSTNHTSGGQSIELPLSQSLTQSLKTLANQEKATLFMVLLGTFNLLLYRYSSQTDISIGAPIANRNRAQTEPIFGPLINTLVLRTDLSGNPTFTNLLNQIRKTVSEAYAHQDVPFEKIVETLRPERELNHPSFFQVMFNMHHVAGYELEAIGWRVKVLPSPDVDSKYDFTLYAQVHPQTIVLQLIYKKDLFDSETMHQMLQQLKHLLTQIVANPTKPCSDYSLITPERQSLFPDPSLELSEPEQELITTLIDNHAKERPNHVAIRHKQDRWTYKELTERAKNIARLLVANKVDSGDTVAVYGSRSFELIASMLGVFWSGGVLLLIDPALPEERKLLMLEVAKAKKLITVGAPQNRTSWLTEIPKIDILHINHEAERVRENLSESEIDHLPALKSIDAAYIFFTSGTSGIPKGVRGWHKGLSHFINWQRTTFSIEPTDRAAQLTGLSFDVVLRDILTPLASGATLCLPETSNMLGSSEVISWLERERITMFHTVPSIIQAWLTQGVPQAELASLRWIFSAGEPLPQTLIEQWFDNFPQSQGEFVNLYGPTETTLAKCYYHVPTPPLPGIQPIGQSMSDTQLLILSPYQKLCGLNETGEIVIRTPFRSLGYINPAEKDLRRFISNPFNNDDQDLLYLTGDRGRYRPDGFVDILGRLDDQIKIDGVRIQPNEITITLNQHPRIKSSFVTAKKNKADQYYLIAYLVADDEAAMTTAALRTYLSQHLPTAFIPSFFIFLPTIPLTANGKVDRRALPSPEDEPNPSSDTKYVAPRDNLELQLVKLWEQTLKRQPIGINDDFFGLGGHSLLAVQLFAKLEKAFNKNLPLATLIKAPTVAALATILRDEGWEPTWASLVPIQPNGKKTPFFCVHAIGGNILSLYDLGRHLGQEQPFYGLQSEGLNGKPITPRSVEEIAAYYLEEIRTIQPHGPYYIAGQSSGGVIAFEIAHQLVAKNETVALLALIDTFRPGHRQRLKNSIPLSNKLLYYINLLLQSDTDKTDKALSQTKQMIERRYTKIHTKIMRAINKLYLLSGRALPHTRRYIEVEAVLHKSIGNYILRPFPGKITLFRSSHHAVGYIGNQLDPDRGWNELAAGGLEIHEILGHHNLEQEPSVGLLAEQLRRCLAET